MTEVLTDTRMNSSHDQRLSTYCVLYIDREIQRNSHICKCIHVNIYLYLLLNMPFNVIMLIFDTYTLTQGISII